LLDYCLSQRQHGCAYARFLASTEVNKYYQ
jgi:hypothetical protein